MLQPAWWRWLLTVFQILSLFPYLAILKREWNHRIKSNQIQNVQKSNQYQKTLSYLSFAAIIFCGFHTMTVLLAVWFCGYALRIVSFSFYCDRILISFYQVARLEYCFSSDQVHSQKYGYSKCTFRWLYINGVALLLLIFGNLIYHLTTPNRFISQLYSCQARTGYAMGSDFAAFSSYILPIAVTWFLTWDFSIVYLYVRKCYQFVGKHNDIEELQKVSLRVRFILSKVMFLTILLEIEGIFAVISWTLYYEFPGLWSAMVYTPTYAFDGLFNAYMVYLMLSHNDDEYVKFVGFMDTSNMCCCFNWFISKASWYNQEKISENETAPPADLTQTDIEHTMPQRLNVEMSAASQI